jgi:hypothetical protein
MGNPSHLNGLSPSLSYARVLIDESPAELSQESLHEESSSVSSVPSRLPVEAEKSITRLICIRWRSFGMYQGTQTDSLSEWYTNSLIGGKGPVRCNVR